eukprot:scaffold207_cov409-Prasinococcus_capsulatus_cf.AAC.58
MASSYVGNLTGEVKLRSAVSVGRPINWVPPPIQGQGKGQRGRMGDSPRALPSREPHAAAQAVSWNPSRASGCYILSQGPIGGQDSLTALVAAQSPLAGLEEADKLDHQRGRCGGYSGQLRKGRLAVGVVSTGALMSRPRLSWWTPPATQTHDARPSAATGGVRVGGARGCLCRGRVLRKHGNTQLISQRRLHATVTAALRHHYLPLGCPASAAGPFACATDEACATGRVPPAYLGT